MRAYNIDGFGCQIANATLESAKLEHGYRIISAGCLYFFFWCGRTVLLQPSSFFCRIPGSHKE